MKWTKVSNYCLTAPGHTIANYRVIRDGELVWVYQAIRLGSPSVVLCEAGTAQECKAVCRA